MKSDSWRWTRGKGVRSVSGWLWVGICLACGGWPVAAFGDIGGVTDLLGSGSSWRAWKGTNDPLPSTADWRSLEQPTNGWARVAMPVALDPFSIRQNPALSDMRGRYTTLFLRQTFLVAASNRFDRVELGGFVVGGCAIWINGRELVRTRMPAEPVALDDVATPAAGNDNGSFQITLPDGVLQSGQNVIAIRLLNVARSSDELFLWVSLMGFQDRDPPLVERVLPEPDSLLNSLRQVEVVFSERVVGLEAGDLSANGVAATNVTEVSFGDFVFEFPPLEPGTITVSLVPDHGITDTSSSSNALKTPAAWRFYVDPAARLEPLRVTEFLADNERGIRDEDGARQDWIELRNFGKEGVSLAGWALGTDPAGTGRWVFAERTLAAGEYLIVFASGKNRNQPGLPPHTDFKLPKAGGSLFLFEPDGRVAGGFADYPAQFADKSYGVVPGITAAAGYFETPTPGAKNSEGGPGFSPEVAFGESSRTFSGSIGLVLATPDPKAEIRYTTNQAEPTADALRYLGPLVITNMTIVRARSFSPGLLPGPVRTESFFPITEALGAYTSTLPVLVINNFNGGRPPLGGRIPGYVQVFEPGPDGLTRLSDTPVLTSRVGMGTRGSSTADNAKINLRLEFRDEVDEDRKVSIGGLPADGDWVLYGPSQYDPALINNAFAHQLSRNIGRYSPRTRYVEVYTMFRGADPFDVRHYMGVYILEERIETGSERLNLEVVRPGAATPPEVTGGYLFKIDRFGGNDGYVWTPRQQVLVLEPRGTELTFPQQSWLQEHFTQFEDALYGPAFRDRTKGYRPFIDVPSWIDHHLINVVLFNVDALRLSAFFFKPKDGPIQFGPLWDFDRALRSTDGRDINPRVWRSQSQDLGTDFFNYTWWEQLFKDPDFFQEYIDRYEELRRADFGTEALQRLVDSEVAQVVEAQPREAKRWGQRARGGYAAEIRDLKNWLSNRVAFIDGQFVRPPTPRVDATHRFAQVSFEPIPGATTYYTLDGTDPRQSGGAVAPGAVPWPGTMGFGTNAFLTLRTHYPEHRSLVGRNNPPLRSLWSGIVRLPVVVTEPAPRLTEIHFNPAAAAGIADAQELEFVEIQNTSSFEQDFAGFRLRGGIQFDFPTGAVSRLAPGARIVVARNPEAFRSVNSGVSSVTGPYLGRLSNDNDVVELQGRFGEFLQRVEYQDDWSSEADGDGYSLVPVYEGDRLEFLATRHGWRRSSFRGGSPGALDTASVPDMALTVSPEAEGTRLRFRGALGRGYSIWVRESLNADHAWRKIGSVVAPGGVGTLEWLDAEPAGARFYRVATP